MKRVPVRKQLKWRDNGGGLHLIDRGGNYFLNGICQNPLEDRTPGKPAPQLVDNYPAIPGHATSVVGLHITGHITDPVVYKDEHKGYITIKPQK